MDYCFRFCTSCAAILRRASRCCPSDHHAQEEAVLGKSIRQALVEIEQGRDECILLGLEPDKADPELGYIVPAIRHSKRACAIEEFVEKPTMDTATCLIEQGALWNAFILVARAGAMLRILKKMPRARS